MISRWRDPHDRPGSDGKLPAVQEKDTLAAIHEVKLELIMKVTLLATESPGLSEIVQKHDAIEVLRQTPSGERLMFHHIK